MKRTLSWSHCSNGASCDKHDIELDSKYIIKQMGIRRRVKGRRISRYLSDWSWRNSWWFGIRSLFWSHSSIHFKTRLRKLLFRVCVLRSCYHRRWTENEANLAWSQRALISWSSTGFYHLLMWKRSLTKNQRENCDVHKCSSRVRIFCS